MSFSSDVKNELYSVMDNARHCRIAELSALIVFCGRIQPAVDHSEAYTEDSPVATTEDSRAASVKERHGGAVKNHGVVSMLMFSTTHRGVYDKYLLLLKKIFRIDEEQLQISSRLRKNSDVYEVCVPDPETTALILEATDCAPADATGTCAMPGVHSVILRRSCCRRAFVRGAFLAAGSVSDPNRSYHFEIVCGTEELAEGVCSLIRSLEIDARIVQRQKYYVIYVKESAQISDLLGLMGASVSLLDFENVRIMREVRGGVNRKVNCETANIEKTATAAARQIDDIHYIEKTVGLSKLSKALDEMAEVRLQYPTATLAELGDLLEPPVSKSGVNHRLREISRIAEDLRNTRRQ